MWGDTILHFCLQKALYLLLFKAVNFLPTPEVIQFLLDLAFSSGVDLSQTEANGEVGLVLDSDPQWNEQIGLPRDPLGNLIGVPLDTLGEIEDDRK